MRLRIALCPCIVLLAGAASATGYAPGEVLIRLKSDSPLYRAAAELQADARQIRSIPSLGIHRLKLGSKLGVLQAAAKLRTLPYVEFAEPNYFVQAAGEPNDPQFGIQWGHAKIGFPAAWQIGQGSPGVIIAVVDTGVDLTHPDLASKLVPGFDIKNNDPIPQDDHGHGSHVAGIAGAATNNGIGIAGVGYHCRIMPVKVLGANGKGTAEEAAAGIAYAANNGAHIISLSLGTYSNSATLAAAVQSASSAGKLVIGAAGNDARNSPFYPAAHDAAVAVGATDWNDSRTGFTNYGPWVDVAAPGLEIYSTYKNGGYLVMSGTSMAAPHVSGLAGLLWSALGPEANAAVVRQIIESNTVQVGTWLRTGRVDGYEAMLEAQAMSGVTRTAALTDHSVELGHVMQGSFASLLESDDDRLDVIAELLGGQRVIRLTAAAATEWQGEKIALIAEVEGSASSRTEVQVQFWNWQTGQWNVVGSSAFGISDSVVRAQSSDTEAYVGTKGEVLLRMTASLPRNRLFRIRTDRILISSLSSE